MRNGSTYEHSMVDLVFRVLNMSCVSGHDSEGVLCYMQRTVSDTNVGPEHKQSAREAVVPCF